MYTHVDVDAGVGEVRRDYRSPLSRARLVPAVAQAAKVHRPIRRETRRTGRENGVITQILISNARAEPSSEFTN